MARLLVMLELVARDTGEKLVATCRGVGFLLAILLPILGPRLVGTALADQDHRDPLEPSGAVVFFGSVSGGLGLGFGVLLCLVPEATALQAGIVLGAGFHLLCYPASIIIHQALPRLRVRADVLLEERLAAKAQRGDISLAESGAQEGDITLQETEKPPKP